MKRIKKMLCLLLALVLVVGTVLPNIKAKAENTGAVASSTVVDFSVYFEGNFVEGDVSNFTEIHDGQPVHMEAYWINKLNPIVNVTYEGGGTDTFRGWYEVNEGMQTKFGQSPVFLTNQNVKPYAIGSDNEVQVTFMNLTPRTAFVTIVENPIQEIKVMATKPLYEDRGFDTRNDWSSGEMRQYRYYFESYAYVCGTVIEKNGDIFRFNNTSELYHRYGFYPDYESNQSYENQWGLGKHTATLKFMGKTCDFEVELKKNPVQSIEAKYRGVVVEGCNTEPNPSKMEFLFTFTDGTKETFHGYDNFLGQYLYLDYEPQELVNGTWSAGKHYWKSYVWDREILIETDVKKLSDGPIKSISAVATNDLVPEWHTSTRYDYETDQWVDYLPVEETKPEMTVTYHDGSTAVMGYEQLRSTYPEVEAQLTIDNDSPEGFGKRTATLSFYGHTCKYEVNVIENPAERISAICMTPYLEGYTRDLYDVLMNCEVYITVYFKDGRVFTGTQEELYEKFGAGICENHIDAVVGKNVKKIEYMGKTCDLEFEVIPNPNLKKVVAIDAKVKGDVYHVKNSYTKPYYRYEHLIEVTLTCEDGTKLIGTPEELNKQLSKTTVDTVGWSDEQPLVEWGIGKHSVTVRYQMLETQVEVEVIENPYTKAVINEETDGLTVVLEQENASPETYKVKKYQVGTYNGYDWNLHGYLETDKGLLPVETRFAGGTSHDYSKIEYMIINGVKSNSLEGCKWVEAQVLTRMEENAPVVTIKQSSDELKELVLTETDYQEKHVDGVMAWLEIADKTDDVSAKEQQLLEQATGEMGSYKNGTVVDLTVYKQFPSEDGASVSEKVPKLKDEISITVEVPEEILASTTNPSTIMMVRIHNGETQVLPCVYDEATKTITFKTDSFSTYAIAYQAPTTSGGTEPGGTTQGGAGSSVAESQPSDTNGNKAQDSAKKQTAQSSPKTGDHNTIVVYILLCAVSLMTLVVGKKKEY